VVHREANIYDRGSRSFELLIPERSSAGVRMAHEHKKRARIHAYTSRLRERLALGAWAATAPEVAN